MPKKVDYMGRRFGLLLVQEAAPNTKQGASAWWCVCDCGKRTYVRSTDLRRGDSQSCGCATGQLIAAANTTHGQSRTAVYRVWRAMHDRCSNPRTANYANYGGRGIKVCRRWNSFENFKRDMGPRPDGTAIERSNNSKGYSPANCYWATRVAQGNNTRRNRLLTFKGQEKTMANWARETGHPPLRILQRLQRGWSVEKALTTPRFVPLRGKVLHIAEA